MGAIFFSKCTSWSREGAGRIGRVHPLASDRANLGMESTREGRADGPEGLLIKQPFITECPAGAWKPGSVQSPVHTLEEPELVGGIIDEWVDGTRSLS